MYRDLREAAAVASEYARSVRGLIHTKSYSTLEAKAQFDRLLENAQAAWGKQMDECNRLAMLIRDAEQQSASEWNAHVCESPGGKHTVRSLCRKAIGISLRG